LRKAVVRSLSAERQKDEDSMMRYVVVLTFIVASLLLAPLSAEAQEPTPDTSPPAAEAPLDLPALTLSPADLEAAGWPGYGESTGYLAVGPDSVADAFVGGGLTTAEEEARIADELRAAGIERFYARWLGHADPDTGETTREILSYIEEYPDAAGADAGFEIIQAASMAVDPTAQRIAGTRTIGERSQITLYGATEAAATPAATPVDAAGSGPLWLDLAFRLGELNAGVALIDYTGQQPSVADVEALADLLLAKIASEREQETAGLSFQTLRLADAIGSFDAYVRQNGETIAFVGDTEADRQERAALYGSATDGYRVVQYIAVDDDAGFDDDPLAQALLLRFADEAAASAYLAELPALVDADPTFETVTTRAAAPDLGDESVGVAYTTAGPDGGTNHQERVAVRDGADVITVIVRALESAPPVAAVDTLAAAALACLESDGWCPPVAIPDGLIPQATPVP
jgi:hypothetical protein